MKKVIEIKPTNVVDIDEVDIYKKIYAFHVDSLNEIYKLQRFDDRGESKFVFVCMRNSADTWDSGEYVAKQTILSVMNSDNNPKEVMEFENFTEFAEWSIKKLDKGK